MHLRDRQRFTELMQLKGISQRALAQKAHVTQPFISLVMQGQRGVRPETAWRIATSLGVRVEELFVHRAGMGIGTAGHPMPALNSAATHSRGARTGVTGEQCSGARLGRGCSHERRAMTRIDHCAATACR
ncbi:helix-turn-helix domain-containing protein [Streptomyces sp. NPDC001262]|uniref:helix-turn-helix domain-containing protein n=1 Tax=unclassified Streptomyces TaxID=2593676 RepID=UPI0036898E7C